MYIYINMTRSEKFEMTIGELDLNKGQIVMAWQKAQSISWTEFVGNFQYAVVNTYQNAPR